MNRIFIGIALTFCSLAANAGPLLDKFNQDVAAYTSEQAKSPNRVIRYSDDQGALARAVLNPARMVPLVEESMAEINSQDQLKAALEGYKPIAFTYSKAFEQLPGKYDEEYFDSFEVSFQFILGSMKPLKTMRLDEIKDESLRPMVEAAIKMAQALPSILLKIPEKGLEDGRFSPSFVPIAKARIKALRLAASNN